VEHVSATRTVQKLVIVQDLLISVACAGSSDGGVPSEADTAKFITALETAPITRVLATSVGDISTSSTARKRDAEALKKRGIRTAAVTDDAMVRGIVTAVSWLGANIAAFSWANTTGALEYLGVTGLLADQALTALNRLRLEVEAAQIR